MARWRDVPRDGDCQLRRPLRDSTAHREYAENAFDIRGGCGFSFGNGCSDGATEVSMFGGKKPRTTIPIKATGNTPESLRAFPSRGTTALLRGV